MTYLSPHPEAAPRRNGINGRKRRTQAERTQETRARILDAAVDVLRKNGYAHFRTADVAKAAGVSRGAQLHHFATKEKLVYATMEHVFHNVLDKSRARAAALKAGDDVLEAAVADARDFFFSTAFFISLDIATSINKKPFRNKLMAMVRDARLPAERAWREALSARGVSEGSPCACCGRTSRADSTGCWPCGAGLSRGTLNRPGSRGRQPCRV
jgi:AcrR family transcriptional regulator